MTQFPARRKYPVRKVRFLWAAARYPAQQVAALELAREQIPALERAREEKSLLRGGGLHILLQQQASQPTKPKARPIGNALWKRQPIEQSPYTPFAAGQTPYPLEAQPAYDSFNPLQAESPSILRTMRISRPH